MLARRTVPLKCGPVALKLNNIKVNGDNRSIVRNHFWNFKKGQVKVRSQKVIVSH